MRLTAVDFILRAGRALLFPMYKGTFERRRSKRAGPKCRARRQIASIEDFRRVVEYIGRRAGHRQRAHSDSTAISLGASFGVIATAVEPR